MPTLASTSAIGSPISATSVPNCSTWLDRIDRKDDLDFIRQLLP